MRIMIITIILKIFVLNNFLLLINMNNIIKILINNRKLFKLNMENLIPLIQDINIHYTEYNKYIKYNKNNYNRNYIYKNDIFEIICITWLPGQYTKEHEHPENGCIMKLLDGSLYESINRNKNMLHYHHKKNSITFMHNKFGKHLIGNHTDKPSISLHIYSPPNYYN